MLLMTTIMIKIMLAWLARAYSVTTLQIYVCFSDSYKAISLATFPLSK